MAKKEEDVKLAILKKFAKFIKNNNQTVANEEIGMAIWTMWQEYTGRTDRWRRCGACLIPKIGKLKKECQKYGIECD